jgi:uncharacterized protein YjbJ (UPF0337 family)
MTNSNMDEAKGRAKEALGSLTDDEKLKREGRNDQKVGKAKEAVDDVADKAREGIDKVRDKLDRN